MTSTIDPSVPIEREPTTASVRQNFQLAADEITALQTVVPTLQTDVTSLEADVTALQADVATLEDAVPTLQTDIITLQTAIAALQDDVAALKARMMPSQTLITINPLNTSSVDYVTAGIGVTFTPSSSTRAYFSVDGQLGNTQNGSISNAQLIYGEGDPPVAGTLVTATNGVLLAAPTSIYSARSGDYNPFSMSTILSDLVAGRAYWLGVAYQAVSGVCTLSAMSLTAFELMDPLSALEFTDPAS